MILNYNAYHVLRIYIRIYEYLKSTYITKYMLLFTIYHDDFLILRRVDYLLIVQWHLILLNFTLFLLNILLIKYVR